MSTAEATETKSVLTDAMLERFHERAPLYDRENRFFMEDFEELRDAGYLKMNIPIELGGGGMTLTEVAREQRRLAYYAPADAVAVNMHLYWTGSAAGMYEIGDKSFEWLLKEAAAGEIFAAGHSERGNDLPGFLSTTNAERVEGGWKFTGHKNFGTMTPVWTRLGMHGMDTSDPEAPKIVHGFLSRDADNYHIEETWDALGMRATRSDDTVLEGAFVADEYIGRILGAGAMDLWFADLFAWAVSGFANVYYAIARRMTDLTLEYMPTKTSIALGGGSYGLHPEIQHNIAEMVMECDAMEAHLDAAVGAWSDAWAGAASWDDPEIFQRISKLLGMKEMVTRNSFKVANLAVETVGGLGVARKGEFERLFRDARMGPIHPTNPALTRELVAKIALGLDLSAQPRWA